MNFVRENLYESKFVWNLYKGGILNDFCVPCYHIVSNNPPAHVKELYTIIDEKKFEKDIDFFAKEYNFISPEELTGTLYINKLPKNKCILTFDDGYRECYDVIYPILKKKGIPAIFFLVSDLIDNKCLSHFNKKGLIIEKLDVELSKYVTKLLTDNYLYTGNLEADIRKLGRKHLSLLDEIGKFLELDFNRYLKEEEPYLNQEQIIEMHSNGFGFGGHSKDHYNFTELDKDQQRLQITQSIDFIESIIHERTPFFAFPFSSKGFKSEIFKEFSELIFFDTFHGFQKSNSKIIQRFVMDTNESVNSKLVEFKFKKWSYMLRNKKLPVISKIER